MESDVNFAAVFGLSEEPMIEGVRTTLSVQSHAAEDKIAEIEALATQRCPGVFCTANPIPVQTRVQR